VPITVYACTVGILLLALGGALGYLIGRRVEHRTIQRALSPKVSHHETTATYRAAGREVPIEGDEPKTTRRANDDDSGSDQYPATPAKQFPALDRHAETIKVDRFQKKPDTLP
jgi:hypothetical protein